jgi:integrase/recombinase XerD
MYKYDVIPQETALVASDIEDKLQMYIAVKRLDGLSEKTLENYQLNLLKFASCLRKPLAAITVTDLRMFLAVRCKDLKPSSVNGQISILKSFFGWLQYCRIFQLHEPRGPGSRRRRQG